jgi:hypothetical protein
MRQVAATIEAVKSANEDQNVTAPSQRARRKIVIPDVQLHIGDAPSVGNCRPEATGPESILPIVVMDSGLARFTRAPE